jgi:DNA polymerase-3 subunit alpha
MLCRRKRGLIVLSGCQGSYLACATVGGKTIREEDASLKRGTDVAKAFAREFGRWYVVEVQAFPELDKSRRFNALAPKIAKACGARLCATMDCHYTMFEESEVQQILHGLRPGNKQTMEERARTWGYDVPLCPPPNDRSIYRRLRQTGLSKGEAIQAIATTAELAEECNVTLPKMEMVRFPLPEGYTDAITYWRDQLLEGWRFRKLDALPKSKRDEYRKKLVHEMKLIEEKDFVHYFLLVQAGVKYVKELGHPVGPARGSAAASVCAWLLRITEVDPLRKDFNGLLRFERFIDVSRTDLPDIDLDFPGSTRPVLRDFYLRLLGPGCVNNVGTFTYFRSKNSLDDVARVFRIPKWEVETVKGYLIERTNIDLRASSTIEDTIATQPAAAEVFGRYPDLHKAELLEGGIRGFGVHAAALILSNGPITEITNSAEREVPAGSGNIIQAIGLDKKDAEYRGLLKMDYLGLNTMQMLDDCIHSIGMTLDELYALPVDDPKIYEAFCRNDVTGVFQFDGRATRYVNGAVKPTRFQELMDITSLSRPGPLHGGATHDYIAIKHGEMDPTAEHPAIAELTKLTNYQIVFQEQILTILREIGGFPWGAVNAIRTIISKKHGEAAFNAKRQEFLDGAAALHKRHPNMPPMREETADSIWRKMITSGAYSFNAGHAAAYSLISYYTMWFKVYHPTVFFYASLRNTDSNDHDRIKEFLKDCQAFGRTIKVRPPSVRASGVTWEARGAALRAGFEQIPGIGPKMAPAILSARRAAVGGWSEWDDLKTVKGVGPKGIAKIKAWTAKDDPFDVYKLERDCRAIIDAIKRGELHGLPVPTHRAIDIPEEQGTEYEVTWVGAITKRNFRDLFEYHMSKFGQELDPETVRDPELREWVVCFGDDGTERVIIKVDRWRYPNLKGAVSGMDLKTDMIVVTGKRSKYSNARQINAKNLWVIEP